MPQVPKDAALEKENKRRRGKLSCAECRRLKLKCDKMIPCSSCTRRGCKDICPTGSLVTGQGTRFVLADTHKLHTKIAQMSERIRTLEDALEVLQSQSSSDPHPLLARELLGIKSSLDLHAAVEEESKESTHVNEQPQEDPRFIDSFGTLTIHDDGLVTTFYGRSAGHESVLLDDSSAHGATSSRTPQRIQILPLGISGMSDAFPFSHTLSDTSFENLRNYLPSWPEARKLCDLYLDMGPWFYGAVTRNHLFDEILPMWYPDSPHPDNYSYKEGDAHDLSLLFIIFCFGALTDESLPAPPDNPEADLYYGLTKAALSLDSPMERLPSVSTVQALSMMGIYQGLRNGENNIECMWAYFGLSTKLAQSLGLHKDCARWKLPPAEVQKRRALFYELLITDGWQSLSTGRLPTFSLPFVDCELPFDTEQQLDDNGHVIPSFSFWKAKFGAECVAAIVQGTLTSSAPKYSIILDLDRKVRDMELPKYATGSHPVGATLGQTMSHFMPRNYRELSLLYIHRCFFAHALSSSPLDPIKSQYAPSFLAGYRSARELVHSIRVQFSLFPTRIARFWVLWTHAFSATIMLASVVTHAPKAKVASAALVELKNAVSLFEEAAKYGGRSVKLLPVLQRLWDKAQTIYLNSRNGLATPYDKNILAPQGLESKSDELSIFSGKTHTIVKTSQRTQTTSASSSPTNSPTSAAFAGAHPGLIQELNGFDQQISAQIREAYTSYPDIFTRQDQVDISNNAYPSPTQSNEPESNRTSSTNPGSTYQSIRSTQQITSAPDPIISTDTSCGYPRHPPSHPVHAVDQLQTHQSVPPARHFGDYGCHQPQYQSQLSGNRELQHPQQMYYSQSSALQPSREWPSGQVHSFGGDQNPPIHPEHQQDQMSHAYLPRAQYREARQPIIMQQPSSMAYYQHQQSLHHSVTESHYMANGNVQGMIAEDTGLQQTWVSYMERISSPYQFGPS